MKLNDAHSCFVGMTAHDTPLTCCCVHCLALYSGSFNINKAPTKLKDALDQYDIERANTKFGFPKDQTYRNNANTNHATAATNTSTKPPPQNTTRTTVNTSQPPPKQRVVPQPTATSNTRSNHSSTSAATARPNASSSATNTHSVTKKDVVQRTTANPQQLQNHSATLPLQSKNAPDVTTQQARVQNAPPQRVETTAPNASSQGNAKSNPYQHHHPVTQSSLVATSQASTYSAMPPPTATDSLMNTSLYSESSATTAPHLSRPNTSNGRDSSSSRRISIGDGLPIQPVAMVTPAGSSSSHKGNNMTCHTNGKRAPLSNVQHLDPTMAKRPSVNPYSSR